MPLLQGALCVPDVSAPHLADVLSSQPDACTIGSGQDPLLQLLLGGFAGALRISAD